MRRPTLIEWIVLTALGAILVTFAFPWIVDP